MRPTNEQIEWMRHHFTLLASGIGAGDIRPDDFEGAMDLTLARVVDGWPVDDQREPRERTEQ